MDAQFILPGFISGKNIYVTFINLSRQYPEILLPNTSIYTIFDTFYGCIWNGGGITSDSSFSYESIKEIIELFNYGLNISLTFNFTNPLLTKEHYNDTYGNLIAELGNNGKNNILVSNLEFEQYLRQHYRKYDYCRSILAAEQIPYTLTSEYGIYELSVLKRSKNNDWQFLNTIPLDQRERIEFLCNDRCPDNCPRIYTHYKDYAKAQLQLRSEQPELECSMITAKGKFPDYTMKHSQTYISREMIDKEYLPKGFNKFKLAGRFNKEYIILNLLNYLIKPEYKNDMLGFLLNL